MGLNTQSVGNNENLIIELFESKVLVVEDQPLNVLLLKRILSNHFKVESVESGEAAIKWCENHTPDLILLDIVMDGMGGIETCKYLKSLPEISNVPIIFITSSHENEDTCWDVGGVDFIQKPFTKKTVFNRVKTHLTIKLQRDKLTNLVFLDSLTGVFNRRYFDTHIEKVDLNAKRMNEDYALIFIDIDFFKQFNDIYGHLEGDKALKIVAQTIQKTLKRPRDVVIRFGGEEFVIVLPSTDLEGSILVAEDVIKNISALNIPHSVSNFKHLTVSAGIATLRGLKGETEILKVADDKLYISKQLGRNRLSY